MWSQMNTGRRMTKKWTRIVCKQANAGRGNRIEESKKDSESAITGNTDSPETIDKQTDRSEDSAATSEKDASKDSANKKASKAATKYPTRKRKISGMGEETQALVAELSEVEKLTVYQKGDWVLALDLWGTKLTDDCYHSQLKENFQYLFG